MATAVNGNWAHAVPLNETNGFAQPPRTERFGSQDSQTSAYREMRSSSRRRPSEYNVLSDSEASGTRRASIRASNSSATRKRSRNTLKEKKVEPVEENVDDSAWIHRDKLAQIEIQEMEEAGIHVRSSRRSTSAGPDASARTSRSVSRSGARRPMSKDRQAEHMDEEQSGPQFSSFDDYKRVSTIPAADEEEHENFDPTVDSEIRTPEEVAAEQIAQKQHMIRPSTSRIPISKASPVPVPQQVVDRDSPLPRSRNGSGAWSGAWDDMQYARRARGDSVGSQVMLEDGDGARTPSRPASSHMQNENSPPKSRLPNKAAPTSNGRKPSTASNGVARPTSSHLNNKPRTASNTVENAKPRPASRSGHKSRPSTGGHAPEGEAPWIASMYKPDPRLPPDQQILPTHAKRMMQEQWEKDGKTGTAYDRDFNLLNDKELPHKPNLTNTISPAGLSPSKAANSPATSETKPWPLSPTKSDTKSETGSVRPGTSGGYKITPTITAPPPIQRSPNPNVETPQQQQQRRDNEKPHNPTPRVPDYDEKGGEATPKKGCCCMVM